MNNEVFKQFRLALAGMAIAIFLVACGGGDSSSESSENSTETPTTSEPSNSVAESRYKIIAGEWRGTLEGLGRNGDEEKDFTFTIDLNGVGLIDGVILHVDTFIPEENRFTLVIDCKTSPPDCHNLIFATYNSDGTRITEGFYGSGLSPTFFTAVKTRRFGS